MSNQTIDGVRRELLENCASYMEGSASGTVQLWHNKLRALLDAPSPSPVPVAWMRFDDDQKAIFTRSKRANNSEALYAHPTAYRHSAPAAQPQGEPVAMMTDGREGEPCVWFSRPPTGTKLYAEQPAPVAPTHINYGALDPVERLAVCRGEVALVAVVLPERLTAAELEELEVIEAFIHGQGLSNLAGTMAAARQFIDEVTRLNPSL